MNVYDSQKLALLLEAEYEPVVDAKAADLILINTCSVRDKPEQKVYSYVGELRELKKTNPNLLIGVGGCVAQQEGEKILKRDKSVNFVFGTHNISLVPALIKQCLLTGRPASALDYREEWENLPIGLGNNQGVSAFVAISRGCNKRCTYCIVPTTRGGEVSRAPDEIISEIKLLVRQGVKEVTLLGQTVNSYGIDLKPVFNFTALLKNVVQIAGLERVRFTSPHPNFMTKELIDFVASESKICRSFHVPLQSGSDRILKLMKRGYDKARFLKMVADIREAVPEMAFTTDVIVGFPSETKDDFLETLDVLKQVGFATSFSFAYSPRPDTPAAEMPEQVEQCEKLARLYEYQAEQDKISQTYLQSWIGKTCKILIDGVTSDNNKLYCGRNSQNLVVNLAAESEAIKQGSLVQVNIISAGHHTLKGEVLNSI